MNDISEEMATKLAKSFNDTSEAFKGLEIQMEQAAKATCELVVTIAVNQVLTYLEKALKSTWVTRWYWKRKYKKANAQLEKLLIIISPTPDLSFNNDDL